MIDILKNPVIVLNLEKDAARRQHIQELFHKHKLRNFIFHKGISKDDIKVKEFYQEKKVSPYPNCFRCKRRACNCDNNIIIPSQVANWLSFVEIWTRVSEVEGYHLICEDDVYFYDDSIKRLTEYLSTQQSIDEPHLIRLGNSGEKVDITPSEIDDLRVAEDVVMSNCAYIINSRMAKYLLREFSTIDHTSDVWLHKEIALRNEVVSHTLLPLIATDLSYNVEYAKFCSNIHPKGLGSEDENRKDCHIKRVNDENEYRIIFSDWLNGTNYLQNFLIMRKRQADTIKNIGPNLVKRQYDNVIENMYEKEYSYRNSFVEWKSVGLNDTPLPWITYSAIYYLDQLDFSNSIAFEWGSGGSSHYLAKKCKRVVSVESNKDWYEEVLKNQASNHSLYFRQSFEYAPEIKNHKISYDVILVDGDIFIRHECVYYAVDYLNEGGIIILDNSDWLENTCRFLRSNGFTQIDFAGPTPINPYMSCTSIFFKEGIYFPNANSKRPSFLTSGIHQERDYKII